jgi:hypothetical protein
LVTLSTAHSAACSTDFLIISVACFQLKTLLKDAQKLLSNMAIYISQARRDEARHVIDPLRSLATDIEHIEENGIYHMLCSLQMSSQHHGIHWDPNVAGGVVMLDCHSFDHHAPIDNRNYMVFWVLENLLDRLQSDRRGKRYALYGNSGTAKSSAAVVHTSQTPAAVRDVQTNIEI